MKVFSVRFWISAFLVVLSLVCGVLLLFLGIRGTAERNSRIDGFETTTGYFSNYTLYSEGKTSVAGRHKSPSYSLTYTYYVNDMQYSVTTDYGTGVIPEKGSTRQILYDPAAPENAYLDGTNSNTVLIFGGILFTAVPIVFIIGYLFLNGVFDRLRINIMDCIVGLVLAGVGFAVFMFSESLGLFVLIPILFIAVGLFLLIRGLFLTKKIK